MRWESGFPRPFQARAKVKPQREHCGYGRFVRAVNWAKAPICTSTVVAARIVVPDLSAEVAA